MKPLDDETTPSETSTFDTEHIYAHIKMVVDVEHTRCKEQLDIQLSWCMYKQYGTLLEMEYHYLERTVYIYIYILVQEQVIKII